jgi:hypothetical protein
MNVTQKEYEENNTRENKQKRNIQIGMAIFVYNSKIFGTATQSTAMAPLCLQRFLRRETMS